MHASVVQPFMSLQVIGVPEHAPAAQTSALVQALASSHAAVLFAKPQPEAGAHVAVVHGFVSSGQVRVVPTHAPIALHASPVVHIEPSEHARPAAGVCTQPPALQESSVHGFMSSQPMAVPAHTPVIEQTSPVVHASPSLHSAPGLTVLRQPVDVAQESVVQGFESSQLTADPPVQAAAAVHVVPLVHMSPSSQAAPVSTTQTKRRHARHVAHVPAPGPQSSSVVGKSVVQLSVSRVTGSRTATRLLPGTERPVMPG
jgi:hypothetical protein